MGIKENYLRIRKEVPDYVEVVLAAKTRSAEEIKEAILAGAEIIGENYVQETERVYEQLGPLAQKVKWHFIGHLQKNKINKALQIFDVIQTIDSYEIAETINKKAEKIAKGVSVFIEINIAAERNKSGIEPDYKIVEELARKISRLRYLRLEGLMTMGPLTDDPEDLRPYFRQMKEFFDKLKNLNLPSANIKYLSMGMSDSYRVAIEEGANMVRIGTGIFGERIY